MILDITLKHSKPPLDTFGTCAKPTTGHRGPKTPVIRPNYIVDILHFYYTRQNHAQRTPNFICILAVADSSLAGTHFSPWVSWPRNWEENKDLSEDTTCRPGGNVDTPSVVSVVTQKYNKDPTGVAGPDRRAEGLKGATVLYAILYPWCAYYTASVQAG